MTTLFETIKVLDGEAQNIEYHQDRFDKSRSELFNSSTKIDLALLVNAPSDKLLRCKITYRDDIISIEYFPYKQKEFKDFIIIETKVDYSYKYSDRDYFNDLSKEYNEFDDIILSKNGFLCDTTIANIAFLDGDQWITPRIPLLFGTTRARLLESKFLMEKDIKINDISKFKRFAIMNAMIGFHEIKDFTIKGI